MSRTVADILYDPEDEHIYRLYKWHISDTGYAVWRGIKDGRKQTVRLHRLITQAPPGMVVDHINHNTLDNRRSNLRVCTQIENTRNRANPGKGYWYQKQNRNWVAEVNGKHIGCFDTEAEAARIVVLVRSGGTYTKPERTVCKHRHSLADAYMYGGRKLRRTCQSLRSKAYFSESTLQSRDRLPWSVRVDMTGHGTRQITATAGYARLLEVKSKGNNMSGTQSGAKSMVETMVKRLGSDEAVPRLHAGERR